jgi:hypothetical protein
LLLWLIGVSLFWTVRLCPILLYERTKTGESEASLKVDTPSLLLLVRDLSVLRADGGSELVFDYDSPTLDEVLKRGHLQNHRPVGLYKKGGLLPALALRLVPPRIELCRRRRVELSDVMLVQRAAV